MRMPMDALRASTFLDSAVVRLPCAGLRRCLTSAEFLAEVKTNLRALMFLPGAIKVPRNSCLSLGDTKEFQSPCSGFLTR